MSKTLWMTGLSGAGKSTLANAMLLRLKAKNQSVVIVDGDELRTGLCANLGFSREDRRENVRRAAQACRMLNDAGVTVIAALVSPYREDRAMVREIVGEQAFLEVWIATSLEVCELRDTKGLYRKARANLVPAFTGISDPYEPPLNASLVLDTAALSIPHCVKRLERTLLGHALASNSNGFAEKSWPLLRKSL